MCRMMLTTMLPASIISGHAVQLERELHAWWKVIAVSHISSTAICLYDGPSVVLTFGKFLISSLFLVIYLNEFKYCFVLYR